MRNFYQNGTQYNYTQQFEIFLDCVGASFDSDKWSSLKRAKYTSRKNILHWSNTPTLVSGSDVDVIKILFSSLSLRQNKNVNKHFITC